MKKYLLFLSLISIILVGFPEISLAKKRYRYIKREHGVRFDANVPMNINPFGLSLNLDGAYTYNWKGFVEVGPYGEVDAILLPSINYNYYGGGLLVEYNFIKNRGKRKQIPAVGIKVGIENAGGSLDMTAGIHTTLKMFIAKRTAFNITAGYIGTLPTSALNDITALKHYVDVSAGFAYYFDFY